MPTITIDGKELTVEKGKTIIQAADEAGIDIPRYCYHPGLSIVGQCRICLVEVEKMPKLQVACYTPVMDGMVVHTQSERARKGRKDVLEFLLVNHPIDCPVCDQAGECFLQDYYMKFGLYDSKMLEDKNKKSKAVPIGKHIVLDSERCILCTRCIRFCDEVSKTNELGIFHRGDHAELLPYPGKTVDNPYSVNVVDICPVGALTEKDFRFRTRVWYLDETNSVCTGCSTGCNIEVHTNKKREYKNEGRRVTRLKPRFNKDVNEYWICDEGRYSFTYVDAADRLGVVMKRVKGELQESTWAEVMPEVLTALQSAKENNKRIALLGSPKMTNEDLFALKKFASQTLGVSQMPVTVLPKEKPFSDDFLIREDKNPNTKGAGYLGYDTDHKATRKLLDDCASGGVELLIIFHHDLEAGFETELVKSALSGAKTVVFVGSNANTTSARATYILPSCTYVEKEGTFTNFAGRVQKINRAIEPLGDSLPEWTIIRNLSRKIGKALAYFEAEDVFKDLTKNTAAFSGMSYSAIGDGGLVAEENGKLKQGDAKAAAQKTETATA